MDLLFNTAPGFDQPFAVLKHCHDRIRKQITTLNKLLSHLPEHGANAEAQQAAQAILRYFSIAAPLHHEDEENDLLPMLQQSAQGENAEQLQQWIATILQEHHRMADLWLTIEAQLLAISTGSSSVLAAKDVQDFTEIYAGHMALEESKVAPMAMRLFSPTQITQLGKAMQQRRAIHND